MPIFQLFLVSVLFFCSFSSSPLAAPSSPSSLPQFPQSKDQNLDELIEIDAEAYEKLTPQAQKALTEYLKNLADIAVRTSLDAPLPDSAFVQEGKGNGEIVLIESPQPGVNDEELKALAYDEKGNRLSVPAEEMSRLRQTGVFHIEDRRYPGRFHVWRVSAILQTGTDAIRITLNQRLANGLTDLVIYLPRRVFGKRPLSIRNGLKHVLLATRSTISQIVGLIHLRPKYSPNEIAVLIENERTRMVRDEMVRNNYDDRLYDPRIQKALYPIVSEIVERFEKSWTRRAQDIRAGARKRLSQEGKKGEALEKAIVEEVDHYRNIALLEEIKKSRELKRVKIPKEDGKPKRMEEGLEVLLIRQYRALQIVKEREIAFREEMRLFEEAFRSELDSRYPIRSRVNEWRENEVREAVLAKEAQAHSEFVQETFNELLNHDLAGEAAAFGAQAYFAEEIHESLLASLRSKKVPSKFFFLKKWAADRSDLSQWTVEKGDGGFFGKPWKEVSVHTGTPYWRVELAYCRWISWTRGSYEWFRSSLNHGRFSLRAALAKKPYYASWSIDSRTGQLVRDRKEIWTLRSKLKVTWVSIEKKIQDYQKAPEGVIPKQLTRFLHKIALRGIWGPTATAIHLGWHLGGGAVAGVVNTVGMVSSPLISAAATGMAGVFQLVIRDGSTEGKPRMAPLLTHVLYENVLINAGVKGVGQAALSAIAASYSIGRGMLTGVFASGLWGVRHTWDAVLFQFLDGRVQRATRSVLNKLTFGFLRGPESDTGRINIPEGESFLNRRISGPGLSEEVLWTLSDEAAVVGARAHLEATVLQEYQARVRAYLAEPQVKLTAFYEAYAAVLGQPGLRIEQASRKIEEKHSPLLREFQTAAHARQMILEAVYDEGSFNQLHLRREALSRAIQKLAVSSQIYMENVLSQDEIELLFEAKGVVRGNWAAFGAKMLEETFGENVLIPLEEADAQLRVIESQSKDLSEILRVLNEGGSIKRTRRLQLEAQVEGLIRGGKEVTSPIPYIQARELCEGDFLSSR